MSRSTLNKILSFYNVDKDLFAEAANTGDQNMNLSSQSIINAFCQSVSEKFVALHTNTHTHTFISTSHKYNQSDIQIFGQIHFQRHLKCSLNPGSCRSADHLSIRSLFSFLREKLELAWTKRPCGHFVKIDGQLKQVFETRSILTLQTFILLYIIHHASITEGRLRKSKGHSRRSSTSLHLTGHQRAAHKSPKSGFKKKKRKTKCRSSTCHTYKQSQASGLETESRKGMIILLTVLRLCGSRVALEDRRIYCTLNQTYMNVQFVYECIHRSASIF